MSNLPEKPSEQQPPQQPGAAEEHCMILSELQGKKYCFYDSLTQFNAEEEIELFCWHCSASELVFNFPLSH